MTLHDDEESGGEEEEEEKKHLAKDGNYYKTYEEKRMANIRYNQEHLKAKGLDQESFARIIHNTTKTPERPRSARKQRSVIEEDHTMVRRSSTRQRKAPEPFQILDDDMDRSIARNLYKAKKRRIVNNNNNSTVAPLTEEQRNQLRQDVEWMDELEDYLKHKEQLSHQNLRSVMRQVEKLVSGEGITYSQWDEGVFFAKGSPVQLSDNFDDLYEQAVLFEDEHGRDRGNGWLLRHPIKKLQNFQRYRLDETNTDK